MRDDVRARAPSASFEPIWSKCQCVLKTVWTCAPFGSCRKAATSGAPDAAAPLSTTTRPSPVESATTLPPAPESTSSLSVTRGSFAIASAARARRASGANARPVHAPIARAARLDGESLGLGTFRSSAREHRQAQTPAISPVLSDEALELEPGLVEHREMQVRERRVIRQLDVLAALAARRSRRRRA